MTSLLDRKTPRASTNMRTDTDFRLPVPSRNRKPLLAVASAALVFVSIAGFASLYASANRQSSVVIVTRTIQQGQQITGADLGQTSAAIGNGVIPIAVGDASVLSGKRAAVTIPAGSLLTLRDVTGTPQIPAGDAVVGIALKVGQLPAAGLVTGDQVMIIQTASPGTALPASTTVPATAAFGAVGSGTASGSQQAGSTLGILVPQATVFDVELPAGSAGGNISELISVEVSSTLAASVSTAAAADQISLVLLPQTQSAGGQPTSPPTHGTSTSPSSSQSGVGR